ncbi:MAG TPA: tetratricopeptide repeat protein [Candidatus Parabacteroides faecavium]|nr:tetratricopeptide repeat protein [Candidatus Parabacteroides faecavium]
MGKRFIFLSIFFISCGFGSLSAQTYEEWIQKSCDYFDKNDLVSAEEALKNAMREEPGNPANFALLCNLGTIQRRQGKKQEAIVSYTAALSRHPKSVTILENRASLYTELGEIDKAINDYNALLIVDPEHQESLYARGLLYLAQKKYAAAEGDFDKILQLNEKSVLARMGYAILEKTRGNYEESERIYNYLIDKMPRDWILYEGRADLYFLMGKNARAMSDINRIFVESTPNASLYILRGKVKLAQYEKESAKKDFLKAQEMGYDQAIVEELLRMCE